MEMIPIFGWVSPRAREGLEELQDEFEKQSGEYWTKSQAILRQDAKEQGVSFETLEEVLAKLNLNSKEFRQRRSFGLKIISTLSTEPPVAAYECPLGCNWVIGPPIGDEEFQRCRVCWGLIGTRTTIFEVCEGP